MFAFSNCVLHLTKWLKFLSTTSRLGCSCTLWLRDVCPTGGHVCSGSNKSRTKTRLQEWNNRRTFHGHGTEGDLLWPVFRSLGGNHGVDLLHGELWIHCRRWRSAESWLSCEVGIFKWNHGMYKSREFSSISCTKSQNLNIARLVLQLSLPNPSKPDRKSRMRM